MLVVANIYLQKLQQLYQWCYVKDVVVIIQLMAMSVCFFNPQRWLCDNDCSKSLTTSGRVRFENIVRLSKLRGDGIHVDLE